MRPKPKPALVPCADKLLSLLEDCFGYKPDGGARGVPSVEFDFHRDWTLAGGMLFIQDRDLDDDGGGDQEYEWEVLADWRGVDCTLVLVGTLGGDVLRVYANEHEEKAS